MRRRLLPVDWWVAACNTAIMLVWMPRAASEPLARWCIAVHGVALTLPWLLRRLPARPRPAVRALRAVYPLLLLVACWLELGMRHGVVDTASNDAAIVALDLAIFGSHLNLAWMPAMPAPWFRELMFGFYWSYYPLMVGVPLLLLARRCHRTTREVVLRLAVTYLACFIVYFTFPVVGPLDLFPAWHPPDGDGLFARLTWAMHAGGNSLGTAFPSSHAAGAVTFAVLAWRRGGPGLAALATLCAAGVVLATVYTQNHFAVDAAAGVLLALLLQARVVPVLEPRLAVRSAPDTAARRLDLRPLRPLTRPSAA